ncbi:MotA/TolQ/ExbB proton channel family protein [Acinetobacter sp. C26M]|uniref:MotA/TolQ/ExbB proton channel family protein n=1 Tax=unclassified Acinetobacter TaxID=196816 RepID=UPI00141F8939|nr:MULTISPECIES: MotA/TolQ/ExbB proton channel family protein [unclassified Acinetobacter]NIE95825.1 MotA/TolQ/ExbB proton channel family protein [Acinetobacter sp. Tr-809]USA47321.1 MotA/TolQ/ExbB proton channel family protein [Acinetobacter sp. C26M]USA50802.1 MotA/TolQ/ExbB proton channel family protein [Acinetobacter sp. C26G]
MKNTAKRISRIAAIGLIAGTTLLPVATVWADETTQTTAVTTVTTDATAQAAPTPPPLPATAEKVHNPYGLEALWREGDLVAKSTLFILVLMSIGTWYIILSKVFQQSKIKRHGTEAERHFWEAESLNSAAESLNSNSSYRYIAEKGIRSTKHHDGTLLERIDFNTWVTISIQRAIEKVQSHLSNGLAFLATVGSTAPFVGLFGTVWGIYHALTAIGISGQASIDKVAGPVGEALIMTAIGLAVAVPAVLGYNWLTRRNKAVMDNVRSFGSDLHAVLLSGDLNSNHPNRDSK